MAHKVFISLECLFDITATGAAVFWPICRMQTSQIKCNSRRLNVVSVPQKGIAEKVSLFIRIRPLSFVSAPTSILTLENGTGVCLQ
jgi:hypothetical protein